MRLNLQMYHRNFVLGAHLYVKYIKQSLARAFSFTCCCKQLANTTLVIHHIEKTSEYHDKRRAKNCLYCDTVIVYMASFRQIIHWHCFVFTSWYTPNGFKSSCKLMHLLLSSGAAASSPTGSTCMSHLWLSYKENVNATDQKVRNYIDSYFSRWSDSCSLHI